MEQAKEVKDGLFSFLRSLLTGCRRILLLEDIDKVNFASCRTFNMCELVNCQVDVSIDECAISDETDKNAEFFKTTISLYSVNNI